MTKGRVLVCLFALAAASVTCFDNSSKETAINTDSNLLLTMKPAPPPDSGKTFMYVFIGIFAVVGLAAPCCCLWCCGFGRHGVRHGSAAARYHSLNGDVEEGSYFSVWQAAGAGGRGKGLCIVSLLCAAALGTGSWFLFNYLHELLITRS